MKADDKLQILKFFLMLVNSVFVILGISIFACSAWILFDKDNFISVISSEQEVRLVAGGLFFIGLVVVGVSLLGCIGAYLENRCFIIFYLSFLIVIILGQIFITLVLLIKRQSIETNLANSVDDIIKVYGGNKTHTTWNLLDSVQRSANCCGRLTPDDWQNNTAIRSLVGTNIYPCSCFNDTCPLISGTDRFGNGSNIHKTGCEKVLKDWLGMNIIVIFGMDAGLLLIQVLQFIFGVHTYKCISRKMRELHPSKLLNAMEESPASEPVHQQYGTHQPEVQTYNPHLDSGHDHGDYKHGGYNHGGYDHGGYDHGDYNHSGYDHGGYDHGGYDHGGYDHGGYDHGGYDHGGYDHGGYDHAAYIPENYDQHDNREFYEHDNSRSYNTQHNLEYPQGYNVCHDQRDIQNYHQSYNDDY